MTTVIEEKDVIEFEKKIRSKLPKSYRNAILKKNGKSFQIDGQRWYLYPLYSQNDCKVCNCEVKGVIESTMEWADTPSYPKGAISIAEVSPGDVLVFFRGEDNYFRWSLATAETTAFCDARLEFTPLDYQA